MTLELTIVVPAFNEAHRLSEGIKRFDAAVADGAVDIRRTELLVVDDGSTDGTATTARNLLTHLPHHRVVSHPVNRGKGAAVRTGVTLARSPYTAYMDADMAIDPGPSRGWSTGSCSTTWPSGRGHWPIRWSRARTPCGQSWEGSSIVSSPPAPVSA